MVRRFFAFWCAVFVAFAASGLAEGLQPTVTVDIPMRDGMVLPADIFLPSAEARKWPCVVIRAPNGRATYAELYAPLASQGYAVIFQDTRSRCDVDGKTLPFLSDGWGSLQDGYDTLKWIYESPYCNGKIGTVGLSAQGITQLLLAPTRPPGLVCQHIGVAAASIYDHAIFHGGQLCKHLVESWLGYYAPHPSVYDFTIKNCRQYWHCFDTMAKAPEVEVPAVHLGGWYDIFLEGTIQSFLSRQHNGAEGARGTQKLVIGPWTHFWPAEQALGDFAVPTAGRQMPVDYSPQRWLDHYLKGVENGVESSPAVVYYVMGPFDESPSAGNVWKTSDVWPPQAQQTLFYMGQGGQLVADRSKVAEGTQTYVADSANPVPTLGGRNLMLRAGPVDQRPIESRPDVLVFSTEPFVEDVEITGHLWADVLLTTDAVDTDVVVRVSDVYPDGRSILITDGVRRLGDVVRCDCGPGPHHVEVDLWSTSIVVAKGHRLRVSVSSSNYPRYDQTQQGAAGVTTRNTLHFGGNRASRLVVPVVSGSH